MFSNVVLSMYAAAYTKGQDEESYTIAYDCESAAPFFEGHPLFLEPASRCARPDGRIQATFRRNGETQITLTASLLRDLVEMFAFFQKNHLAFTKDTSENFVTQGSHLVVARPWELSHDLAGSALRQSQKNTGSLFQTSGLSSSEHDCLKHFANGLSPSMLFNHPVFWTVDRRKCFILDLANSRTDLRQPAVQRGMQRGMPQVMPQVANDWVDFVGRSDLKIAMTHQAKFIEKSGKTFCTGYSRFDLMDLVIFTSNIVRSS